MRSKKSLILYSDYLVIVFIFLLTSWVFFFHELMHYSVCAAFGYNSVITIKSDGFPETACAEINNAQYYQKILYIMFPYIVGAVVFFCIAFIMIKTNWRIKDSILRLMPYVIGIDLGVNYYKSVMTKTDFWELFFLIGNFAYLVMILVAVVLTGLAFYAMKDLKKLFRTDRQKEERFEKI